MSNEGATTQPDLIETELEGTALLTNPMLNKGTAFTEEERTAFALHGLLPPHLGTLEVQSARRLQAMRKLASDLDRYVFLRGLQDANETLFYAVLTQNLEEMLPLVYTPTVGEGCQTFSHYWHYPRGLFSELAAARPDQGNPGAPALRQGGGYCRQRWRADPRSGGPGRRWHGHPDR